MSDDIMVTAVRGYTWPPFEEGNAAAATHGANSLKLVEPHAREIAPAIFTAHPHLDPARDGAAVWRYAITLARIHRVNVWLAQREDPVFADLEAGAPHKVFERLDRWERQAAADEERLGLSPGARVKLGLDLARAKKATLRGFIEGEGHEG
jgi:hypothetical protein